MRYAPAYSAERFPGDFAAAVVCGAVTAALLGPLIWWFAREYLLRTYPHHPELLGAAVVTGILDGLLLAILAAAACFAVRIWTWERRERKRSDETLRADLDAIVDERNRRPGAYSPGPRR